MAKISPPILPHSWPINSWPPGVYPNTTTSGRYLVRAHRDELIAAGALSRVGRELVVLGAGYGVFLARQAERVADYACPANAARGAAAKGFK